MSSLKILKLPKKQHSNKKITKQNKTEWKKKKTCSSLTMLSGN